MIEGPVVKKTFAFSISIFKYCMVLTNKLEFVIANQLMKSGTSIGANVIQAQLLKVKTTLFKR